MKHLKTFEKHTAVNEDWLDDIRKERIEKAQKLGIESGDFVSLSGEYYDVWHEVAEVLDTYITVYKAVNAKQPEVKTDLVSLSKVTNHSKSLPSDTRVFALKTGHYSPNTGNLGDIPTFYKRNMAVDSIVGEE